MCGIGGAITHREGLSATLQAMVVALAHRGPDDHGVEVLSAGSASIGLCATRLAIQDLSRRGHQPMAGPSGTVVVLNGEIYNAPELRNTLRNGHAFHGNSDTEVVLRAYEEWGPRFLDRLQGMFAIALWDPRSESLLLVRDRLGIKPLYLAQHANGELLFASEIRAIVPHLVGTPSISSSGLASYLSTGAVVEPDTLIEGIMMLPAGFVGIWKAGELRLHQYWSLEDAFNAPRSEVDSRGIREELRERLEAAVRAQLISDAPLAVFLSGGMDSSALVGLVSRVSARAPSTASIVFGEEAYSEAGYIQTVCDRFQTDHHEVKLSAEEFLREIPNALSAMDQPTSDGVNTYVVSKLARQAGFTVVLSGLGGDELFGGYQHFRSIPRLQSLRKLPGPLAEVASEVARLRYGEGDRARKLARWLRGETDDAVELQRELFEPAVRAELFPSGASRSRPTARPAIDDRINAISYAEIVGYMRNVLLRDADVMSMAHGLELRVPLLDERIVDCMAKLPGRRKVARGQNKPMLANAVSDLLPPSIALRRKAGFVLPFKHWLRGPLRSEVEAKLLDPSHGGQVAEQLDPQAVRSTWQSYLAGTSTWHRPWSLYVLKVWGERHTASSALVESGQISG